MSAFAESLSVNRRAATHATLRDSMCDRTSKRSRYGSALNDWIEVKMPSYVLRWVLCLVAIHHLPNRLPGLNPAALSSND